MELQRSLHDDTDPLCCEEGCDGQVSMTRLISAPAFHLKGFGWASDGYSKGGMP